MKCTSIITVRDVCLLNELLLSVLLSFAAASANLLFLSASSLLSLICRFKFSFGLVGKYDLRVSLEIVTMGAFLAMTAAALASFVSHFRLRCVVKVGAVGVLAAAAESPAITVDDDDSETAVLLSPSVTLLLLLLRVVGSEDEEEGDEEVATAGAATVGVVDSAAAVPVALTSSTNTDS